LCLAGQSQESAVLSIPDNHHDFGRIMEDGGKVSYRFVFENSGNESLAITNIRTTCGCTAPSWSTETVSAGKKGYIDVEFDPKGRTGPFHKTLQVQSTATNANMFLTISGNVLPAIKIEELKYSLGDLLIKSNHVNLGYLYKGSTGIQNLTIANAADEPIKIDFREVPEHIVITSIPEILQPGEFGQIEVQYCTEKTDEWDVVIDYLPVFLNDGEVLDKQLTITANIREDFRQFTPEQLQLSPVASYTPEIIQLDTLDSSEPRICEFTLTNKGKSDLIIRALKPSCGCTAAKPEKSTLNPGESTQIEAVFDSTGREGEFRNGIAVVTNDPVQYKKYLIIEGYIDTTKK
jgi:hypothetical protein